MANLNIAVEILGKDNASPAVKGFQSSLEGLKGVSGTVTGALGHFATGLGNIGQIMLGGALATGLANLPGKLKEFADMAGEDAAASARLGTTLQSLGGNFTSHLESVNEAIAAGQKLAFSDDEVRNSFQFLAQATGSVEEGLTRQKAAMDLARGANIPLSAATKMLGKLNEENIEVFKRMGITLGENATEADALNTVMAKFGGQAEAFAQSAPGMAEQASLAFAEIQESLGGIILPLFLQVGQILSENLPVIQEWIGAFSEGLQEKVGEALDYVTPLFQDAWDQILRFGDVVNQVIKGDVTQAFGQFMSLLSDMGKNLLGALEGWGRAFVDWLMPRIPEILGALQSFGQQMGDWLQERATFITGKLSEWFVAFRDWLGPKIPEALTALQNYGKQMLDWMTAQYAFVRDNLSKWTDEFIQWIVKATQPMLEKAQDYGTRLLNWMTVTLSSVSNTLVNDWIPTFVNWMDTVIPTLSDKLTALSDQLLAWIDTLGQTSEGEIDEKWVAAFVEWVTKATLKIPELIFKFNAKIIEWLGLLLIEIGEWAEKAIPKLQAAAVRLGESLVRGIWEGAKELVPWLGGKIAGMMGELIEAAKARIKAFSPARVPAEEIGIPFMEGIGLGFEIGLQPLLEQMTEITGALRETGKEGAADAAVAIGDALAEGMRHSLDGIADAIESGGLGFGDPFQRIIDGIGNRIGDGLEDIPSAPGGGGNSGGGSGGGPADTSPGTGGEYSGNLKNDPLYKQLEQNLGWHSQVPGKGPLDLEGVDYDPLLDTERGHGTVGTNKDKSGYYRAFYRLNTLLSANRVTNILTGLQEAVGWVRQNTPQQYWKQLGWSLEGREFGGRVGSNRSYLVGESGPEVLTMGNSSGHITPNSSLGQTVVMNVTVNVPRWIHNADEVAQEVYEALLKLQSRNGGRLQLRTV